MQRYCGDFWLKCFDSFSGKPTCSMQRVIEGRSENREKNGGARFPPLFLPLLFCHYLRKWVLRDICRCHRRTMKDNDTAADHQLHDNPIQQKMGTSNTDQPVKISPQACYFFGREWTIPRRSKNPSVVLDDYGIFPCPGKDRIVHSGIADLVGCRHRPADPFGTPTVGNLCNAWAY